MFCSFFLFVQNNSDKELFAVLEQEAIAKKTSIANVVIARLCEDFLSRKIGVACLVEVKNNEVRAIKTNRNSTYIVVRDTLTWEADTPHYVLRNENNRLIAYKDKI